VTITSNVAEVVAVLNGYTARMRDMRGVMDRIGTYAGNKALLSIMDEKDDPEGRPWTEWRDSTRESREKKGNARFGLLWDDGTLLASINVQAGLQQVTVGTDTPYARFLQDGTSKMAARPILGWSDEDVEYAEQLIALHVTGGI
jgi:phage gpG-like protein